MRVLHVIPSISKHAGGPSAAILPMCRSLRAKGIDVMLATTDDGLDASDLSDRKKFEGLPITVFRKQLGRSFKYSSSFAAWLNENVSLYDLVHIHAVFNHACLVAARACRKQGVPYVVRPLGTLDPWAMKQKSFRKRMFWLFVGRRMLRDAAAIHYTAREEQQTTENSLGLNHGRVIPLGIDANAGERVLSDDVFAARFPALQKNPYVLVLSRLLPTKGLDVLLPAFLSVIQQAEFRKWKLVLAGDGPAEYVGALKRVVGGGSESVIFPGWLEGDLKAAVLSRASLLALPSYHENFGLCVLEALSFGVPVLVSPQVNLATQVQATSAGWISEIDKDAISKKLNEIFAAPEERALRGHAAHDLAQRFCWNNISDELVAAYSSILGTSNRNAISAT